jgi:tryptophan halogenase
MKKIIVVGAGSAGIICASYLKTYWGDNAEITLIYDHSKPGIGVGESLTPIFYKYLNYIGVTTQELIKHANATIKLGLRFENWHNDGTYYNHPFAQVDVDTSNNFSSAYDIITNNYDSDISYSDFYFNECVVPNDNYFNRSLHIDATLFSKYVENKFRDRLTIIDDIVLDLSADETGVIDKLILKNSGEISADLYIDATGFQSVLFNKLPNQWVDKTKEMPLNRCIPNPMAYEYEKIPPFTTSYCSEDGWILNVPLQHRYGTGYIYGSDFCSDEQAFEKFESYLLNRYGKKLTNTSRVIEFESGYWKNQWVGNCIAVGLSSGFSEPLEATNIHHTVFQIITFTEMYNFEVKQYDVDNYNKIMEDFYENVYLFLRYCYTNGRTDTEFWKYMTNNVPPKVQALDDKMKTDIPNSTTFINNEPFGYPNFIKIVNGLRKVDKDRYYQVLKSRSVVDFSKQQSDVINAVKLELHKNTIDHKQYILNILKNN